MGTKLGTPRTSGSDHSATSNRSESSNALPGPSVPFLPGDLPPELGVYTLSFVPAKDLILNCRLVNKTWREAIDSDYLWRLKLLREGATFPAVPPTDTDYKVIYVKRPYERNLLKNWDAEGAFDDWTVLSNAGDRWKVELAVAPSGAKSLPVAESLGCKKCWATSYGWNSKSQKIDLLKEGLSAIFLDQSPRIEVTEWVANRFDCGSIYELHVTLSGNGTGVVKERSLQRERGQWESSEWEKVTCTFEDYGVGVRYITFQHQGKDTQFWAGHFGPKMAAPCVKVMLN